MDEFNQNEKEIETNIDNNKVKLHYDYQSCENILNSSFTNTIDILLSKEEYNNNKNKELYLANQHNNDLNSNLKNVIIPKINTKEIKSNSFNYIPKYELYSQKKNDNLKLIDNNGNGNTFDNDDLNGKNEINIDDNKIFNKINYKNNYLQNIRNNSYNHNKIKITKPNRANFDINNFEKALKYREKNLKDN